MRRSDKEISEIDQIYKIISSAEICRIALSDDNTPYLIPLSFGFENGVIYIHTAKEGKKIEVFKKNPKVCVEFESGVKLVQSGTAACDFSFEYQSVVGFGVIELISGEDEKLFGLNKIMEHYTGKSWSIDLRKLSNTLVWKITTESLTAKRSPGKQPD